MSAYCYAAVINLTDGSMERSSATQRPAAVAGSSRPSSPPDKDNPVKPTVRSQEGSVVATSAPATRGSCAGPASSQQKVKEAVAIAAGKKGMGQSDDDEPGKPTKSNMLCYLYWLLVLLILGLISFTVWLSIQLARRHSVAMMAESKLPVFLTSPSSSLSSSHYHHHIIIIVYQLTHPSQNIAISMLPGWAKTKIMLLSN